MIFEVERDSAIGDLMIKMTHWPHCGMGERTSLSFGKWLIKRSKDIKDDQARQLKMARHKIKGALNLKIGDMVTTTWRGKTIGGVVTDLSTHGKFPGVNVVVVSWEDKQIYIDRPCGFFADGRLHHMQTKPVLRKR